MHHPRALNGQQAALLIIDIQEGFRKRLPDTTELIRQISVLAEAAKILNLPVLLTEQYPQGLGKTLVEIAACLGEHQYFEKNTFSCCGAEGFMQAVESTQRKQIMVCGIEAHVCVNQTVHDLLAAGYDVHLICDAISSRLTRNKEIGLQKMAASGAIVSCTEMALFEMLRQAGTESFKSIQRLIK